MTTMHNRARMHFFDETQPPVSTFDNAMGYLAHQPMSSEDPLVESCCNDCFACAPESGDTLRERVQADYEEAVSLPDWFWWCVVFLVAAGSFVAFALQVAPGIVR